MNQFEVLTLDGKRWLTVVNIDRYDFYIGFRTLIKRLPAPN